MSRYYVEVEAEARDGGYQRCFIYNNAALIAYACMPTAKQAVALAVEQVRVQRRIVPVGCVRD